MAVTVWKGHLTFGLVSIPVRLVRAARHESVGFHQLYRPEPSARSQAPSAPPRPDAREDREEEDTDSSENRIEAVPTPAPFTRVQQAAYLPEAQTQAPIPRENLVKGYEYEKNRYVVIEKEDLEKITPKTATEMQILEFVRISEIDPIHFETSYYVSPEEAGEKPYALLFDALRQSGYVALAEFAMRRRQHAVVIRPGATGIIAHTMYYADEIRKIDEFRTNTQLVTPKERDLAVTLIEAMAAPFEPEKFKDTYREKLQELIAAKIEGKEIVAPQATSKQAPVVDIMDALQKSLAMRRKPVASEVRSGKAKKKIQR
jgi:DNA end-binding protein Ku